jgi:hypothetical protein
MGKRRLRLVQSKPRFDLEKFRTKRSFEIETPAQQRAPGGVGMAHRGQLTEKFARIPYERARKLFRHIGGPAWLLLIELDRLIFTKKRNPIKLTTEALKSSGLTRWQKERALRRLERAGIIRVERKRGRCPLVTHLWYPLRGGSDDE